MAVQEYLNLLHGFYNNIQLLNFIYGPSTDVLFD